MLTIVNILSILFLTDILGLLPPTRSIILRGDATIIISIVIALYTRKYHKNTLFATETKYISHLTILFILISFVSFITLLRGGVNIKDLALSTRIYLPYLLFYSIYTDIILKNNQKIYYLILLFLGAYTTILIMLLSISDIEILQNMPGISTAYQDIQYSDKVKRVYMPTLFLFPVLCFQIKAYQLFKRTSISNIVIAVFFLIGFILQGFRSYIIATIIIISILFIKEYKAGRINIKKYKIKLK